MTPAPAEALLEVAFRSGLPRIYLTIALVGAAIAACGGSKLLEKSPEAVVVERPLATGADGTLSAELNWVVVRNGAGSWVSDADWDEYILRIGNKSASTLRITAVTVYDSLGNGLATTARRPELINQSKRSAKRYRDQGLQVKAGLGGDVLFAAGATAYVAGTAAAAGILTGSLAASSATAAAAVGAAFVVAPAMVIGGTLRNINNNEIAALIVERQSNLPILIEPGETQLQQFFFPIAPSPQRIEITYLDGSVEKQLVIDTASALHGLHLPAADAKKK